MRNGHRRTQSENYCYGISKQVSKINLDQQTYSKIPSLLKKSNRFNKIKTVKIQSIDIQQVTPRSHCMFFFGRKQYQTPTGTSSRFEEDLLKMIPQTINKKRTVKRKSVKKQSRAFQKTLDMNLNICSTISPFSNSNLKSSSLLTSPNKKVSENKKDKCQPYFKNIKSKPNQQKQKLSKPVGKIQSNSDLKKL